MNQFVMMKKRVLVWCMLFVSLMVSAQNVTISPATGNLIAATTYPGEVGFVNGWSSMWRHQQLPLTLTVADDGILSEGGTLQNPAGNISVNTGEYALDSTNGNLVLEGGASPDLYVNISLPKGFRFTGYRMVLVNNLNKRTVNTVMFGFNANVTKTFYETDDKFDQATYKARAKTAAGSYTMPGTNSDDEYVIERTSQTSSDMDNNLYFRLVHNGTDFYAITIKSLEVFFTADGSFTEVLAPQVPTAATEAGASFVECPFATSKLDIGDIKPNTKNGTTMYSYSYQNVQDLMAQNVLYEAAAVNGEGEVAEVGNRGITSVKNGSTFYYGLNNNTYYVETPVDALTQNNDKLLVGYRIVGAKVNYAYGTAQAATTTKVNEGCFYITYTSGGTTYYLNTNAGFVANQKTLWKIDSSGRIYSGNVYLTVSRRNSTYYARTTTNSSSASRFSVSENNISSGGFYLIGTTPGNAPTFSWQSNNRAQWTSAEASVSLPAFTPADYTLKVYDKTGENVEQTVNVNSANANGSFELTGLNNDAIKFSIEGLPNGRKALVTVELTLQALNPYINRLNIVCHDKPNVRTLLQQFTASDFSVRGGKFIFNVPADWAEATPCFFTFERLYSQYGDDTYYDGMDTGTSRYNLVKSAYYDSFTNLYDADPNADYATKVYADVCGTQPFRFNNADELGADNTSTETRHLEEYPFSVAAYQAQTGDYAGATFEKLEMNDAEEKNAYFFTADETRYNIAPTRATEHRSYAFYLMDIMLTLKDYTGEIAWTKLYDTTCYYDDGEAEKSMWGARLSTKDTESGSAVDGYLTATQIQALLDNRTADDEQAPKDLRQVLYLDASNLYSVVFAKNTGAADDDLYRMKKSLGENALIYLPTGQTYDKDNFAYKTESGAFHGCNNFVLTDRKPFYAPFDIQVDAAKYATYTREVTIPKNGQVTSATLMLPFTLTLDSEGRHTNDDGSCSFKLHQMQSTNCLGKDEGVTNIDYAYFPNMKAVGTTSEANTPYIVQVLDVDGSAGTQVSFIARQTGATIKATTAMNTADYTFTGESATGTHEGTAYRFVNTASYAGRKLGTDGYFYFAQNRFVRSNDLGEDYNAVYVYPFRAYYAFTANGGAKGMRLFDVLFGEGKAGDATGISDLSRATAGLAVTAGNGTITLTATTDSQVQVSNLSGQTVVRTMLRKGQTHTVSVPSGIYVVNGVRMVVK